MTRNSRRLQKAVQAIFNDYREKASCPGQVYQNAACGCDNALQMWRGPKGEKGDQGPQGPKGDNAGSFLVDAEFVVDPEGQEPGAYLKLVLIDVAQQEQVVYVDLSYLTDIYEGGNGISIVDMVVAARLGAGLTFDANGNIASAYQFCDGLDETSNVVKVRLDSSNHILGFASGTCGGLTATVGLAPSATGVNLVLTGAGGAVLSTVPLNGSDGITVQKNAQTGGFTWLADPAGLVSSQTGNQLSVSQTDNKLYVGGNTLEYTFGTGAFTLKDSSGATLSSVTVPSAVRMLENMELRTDDGVYLHLTYLRDNGLRAYQDVSLDELLCNNVDTADDTAAAYSKAVPSGNWQTASITELGGRTVVWNQLQQDGNMASGEYWFTTRGNKTIAGNVFTSTCTGSNTTAFYCGNNNRAPCVAGHKYYVTISQRNDNNVSVLKMRLQYSDSSYTDDSLEVSNAAVGIWYRMSTIITVTNTSSIRFILWPTGNFTVGDAFSVANAMIVDLTLLFGAGNEPSTVSEFEAMFPASYYAYDAGTLMSAGVTEVESEGRNIWDEEWEFGTLNFSTGVKQPSTTNLCSKNYIPVLPNTEYYMTTDSNIVSSGMVLCWYDKDKNYISYSYCGNRTVTSPQNAFYALFYWGSTYGTTYKNDTCFNISDPAINGTYYPYFSRTLPIPAAVQALPGYGWSAGTVYNYVDYARKVYVQRVASVDLGTLTWTNYMSGSNTQRFFSNGLNGVAKKPESIANTANILSTKYTSDNITNVIYHHNDKIIACGSGDNTVANILIWDSALQTLTGEDFKAAMSGVMLYYELATPVETDISSLLTDTTIEVEPGGSLTFKNQHDDFRLPVPNSETFIYEHPWVFEDCVKGAMQPAIDALNARIDDVSVELTLDVHCTEIVTPGSREPYSNYYDLVVLYDGDPIASGYVSGGSTISGIIISDPSMVQSFALSAHASSGSDGTNEYVLNASLTDLIAAGSDGLRFPLTQFQKLSGIPYDVPIWVSCEAGEDVDEYVFNIMTGVEERTDTELTADLLSGENRTDLKPLIEKVGGTVSERYTFEDRHIIYNCDIDVCGFDIDGDHEGPSGAVDVAYLDITVPAGGKVYLLIKDPDDSYNTVLTTFEEISVPIERIATETGLRLYNFDFSDYDGSAGLSSYFLFAAVVDEEYPNAELGSDEHIYRFTLKKAVETKQILCLEPSCDPCIDLSPALADTVRSIAPSFECVSRYSDSVLGTFYFYTSGGSLSGSAGFQTTLGEQDTVYSSDAAYEVAINLYFHDGSTLCSYRSSRFNRADLSAGSLIPIDRIGSSTSFPAQVFLEVVSVTSSTLTYILRDPNIFYPQFTLTTVMTDGDESIETLDMSCILDIADEKIAPVQEQITQNASDIAALETKTDITNKNVSNIQALLNGTLYREETDNTAAYSKTVPSGALPYATINEIGGKTVVWNQNNNSQYTSGINGTLKNGASGVAADGVLTLLAVQAGEIYQGSNYYNMRQNHIYYYSVQAKVATAQTDNVIIIQPFSAISLYVKSTSFTTFSGLYTYPNTAQRIYYPRIFDNRTSGWDEIQVTPVAIVDLTQMFGAGNEPSTVAEFEAMFPTIDPAYNAGELMSAGVTEAVSVGRNLVGLTGRTLGTTTEGGATVAKQWDTSKYYLGCTTTGICYPNIITSYSIDGDKVSCTSSSSGYGIGVPVKLIKGETYRITVYSDDTYQCQSIAFYDKDGYYVSTSYTASNEKTISFVMPSDAEIALVVYRAGSVGAVTPPVTLTNCYIMLERGSTATEYTPYFSRTLPIPSAVQALPGYGWSAGTVFNYVDFERKVYVQNVGSVDLGSLVWSYSTRYACWTCSAAVLSQYKFTASSNTVSNIIAEKYSASTLNIIAKEEAAEQSNRPLNIFVGYAYQDTQNQLWCYNGSSESKPSGNAFLELAAPIETDINQYLSDDNLINVEAGGTLTFKNQNGDDFRLPVPNEETYIIDIQEAVSNG